MNVPPLAPLSRGRLMRTIATALAIAGVVLSVGVLPAEYGIDPTGIGRRLGLAELYAAKPAAATAVAQDSTTSPGLVPGRAFEGGKDAVGQPVKPILPSAVHVAPVAYHEDTVSLILAPGKGAEMKTHLQAGQAFVYKWTASAPVASDLHGENAAGPQGDYTSYRIEPPRTADSGALVAPFNGIHGWYWLNSSDRPVMVTLHVTGFHDKLFRPGHP